MLKFLTHKLRTHSINENNFAAAEKENDDHDSGTESDDEIDSTQITGGPVSEHQRVCSVSPADTGCSMDSPAPDHQDAHSSEEELEVINNVNEQRISSRPLRSATGSLPEKRKWSQIGEAYSSRCSPENEENMSQFGNLSPCKCGDTVQMEHSSDEEVQNFLLASMATPVQFRTSPPLEAVKPGGRTPNRIHTLSPPAKLTHYEDSPRKRPKHTRSLQRPYLDFEKMQQLKARSVTAWKHNGDHGGELSVFCW